MSKKPQTEMRSLSDLPKPILILEALGIILLVIVLLAINGYVELPDVLMQKGAFITMVLIAIGCLIPATINIVWRAIHGLSFLGIDNQKTSKSENLQDKSAGQKKDEKNDWSQFY
nr:YbjC family protein [Providencia sneebia]